MEISLEGDRLHSRSEGTLRSLRGFGPQLLCAGLIGTVTLIRWRLLRDTPYPTGIDEGNWLAFGHAILGEHIRSSGLIYPPVVPLMAAAAEHILGTYAGLQVLAFVASVFPPLGVFALLYGWGLKWRGAVLAGFLSASAGTGEAMAWGGYPQLIGLGILPVFILALERFLTSHTILRALPPSLLLAAALATSDLIGPITALTGAIYLVARYTGLLLNHEGISIRNAVLGVGIATLAVLPVLPIYVGLVAGVASNERLKFVSHSATTSALNAFGGVTADLPLFWFVASAAVIPAPLALHKGIPRLLALLGASIVLPSATLVWAGEDRLVYLLPLGAIVGLGAWWAAMDQRPAWSRRMFNAAVITSVVLAIVVGSLYFGQQRSYYTVLNSGIVLGIQELGVITTPDDLIAVSPAPHDWELGWWIEGAGHRRSIYAGNPIWLNFGDEKARNSIANRIFATPNANRGAREAHAAGATYLFIDKEWSGYSAWIGDGTVLSSLSIAYENQSVLILATNG